MQNDGGTALQDQVDDVGLRLSSPDRDHGGGVLRGSADRLKVLVIDESPVRAAVVEEGLREAGYSLIETVSVLGNLAEKVATIDPDIVIVDLGEPSRDVLEQAFAVSRDGTRPVALFVGSSSPEMARSAIEAGVSAYIVNGLSKDRVHPIVETTIARFRAFRDLRTELADARSELAARKSIDQAKAYLIKSRGLSEADAYSLLRRTAMDHQKTIAEIAESLLIAADLTGKEGS